MNLDDREPKAGARLALGARTSTSGAKRLVVSTLRPTVVAVLLTSLAACDGQGGDGAVMPLSMGTPVYSALDRSSDIAGPDTNDNGVRDDIEAWINAQPVIYAQRKALLQDARATQQTLVVDLTDKAALQKVGDGLSAAAKCGGDQFPDYAEFARLSEKIEAMAANTKERAARYMQYNAARSGSTTTRPSGDVCEP